MIALLEQITTHAIMITGFVLMMMVIIEYLNVLSRGVWQRGLRESPWRQYLLAAFLGATPGCLGAFTVVSLYLHREVSLGALVVAMVATSGDESFVMLSMIPEHAPRIFIILIIVGLVAGYFTDAFSSDATCGQAGCQSEFDTHEEDICHCFPWGRLREQWGQSFFTRGILSVVLLLFLLAAVTGQLGPVVWNWLRVTLVILSSIALFIVSTVPAHFLEEHLWNHVVKAHMPRVFLWTFGALLLMHILVDHLHLEFWLQENRLIVLLMACLVGLIPESGPHLLFLTLFVENVIPFSTFLASSIVQDGHGMLPLLAESRRDFIKVKAINLVVGFLTGFIGYSFGW
ncbi:MAG: hypothetical protein GY702_20885 [Desulfobulbaceae bacterium]|nr:hypothetical protein [Desulfobulbaceae bacterium]